MSVFVVVAIASFPQIAAAQISERRFERAIREAETDDTYRSRVDSELSVTERSMFDFGGFINFTAIWLSDNRDNSRRLFQPELTLYGRAVIDGAHQGFVRARFRYRDFSENDSFDGRGDRWSTPFLDRYWYEFDLRRAVEASKGVTQDFNFNVRVGRQFVDWAGGLALSEQLYAARPTLTFGRLEVEGIFGTTTPDQSTVDFDASRNAYNSNTLRGFFGGALRYTTRNNHEFYVYGLYMPDFNSQPEAARLPIGPADFTYESYYLAIGADGSFSPQFLYAAEFVYQGGTSMSDPLRGVQTQQTINAWAARGNLTYLFRDRGRSSIQIETVLASGDDDRLVTTDTVGGNLSGTDDNAFNSLGFAATGLAFAPAVSNIFVIRASGKTFPFRDVEALDQLQLGLDLVVFNKLNKDGPIEEPTTADRFLGIETDFVINYRVTSDFTLVCRLGLFFPGDAIVTSHTRYFTFFGATLSF